MSLPWRHFSKACSLGFQPQIFVTQAFERKLIKTLFVFDTLGSLHKIIEQVRKLFCRTKRDMVVCHIFLQPLLLLLFSSTVFKCVSSTYYLEKRKMYHIIRSFDKVWKGRLRRCGRRFRRSASSITLLHLKTESETPFSYTCMSTPEEDAFFVPESKLQLRQNQLLIKRRSLLRDLDLVLSQSLSSFKLEIALTMVLSP